MSEGLMDDGRPFAGTAMQVAEAEARREADARRAARDGVETLVAQPFSEDRLHLPGDPPIADEVKLLPNGQIRMVIAGQLYVLRTPSMGQLRRYRTAIVDLTRAVAESADARTAAVRDATHNTPSAVAAVDRLADELGSDAEDILADETMNLLREIVADLDVGGRSLPPDNDSLPAWAPNIGIIVSFVKHWRAVPQAPGR